MAGDAGNIGRGYAMLNVPLNPDIERRLSELSKLTGRPESDFARELIESNIEDLEDRYLAEQAIAEDGPRLTGDQVRTALGLER
jgi:predicted DNA-binding protein